MAKKLWAWEKDGVFVLEGEGEPQFLFTIPCAARILGIPQRTLYYAVQRKSIPRIVTRDPVSKKPLYLMAIKHIREACRHYSLDYALVIDRLGDLLDWTDEEKAFCALSWEGISKEDLDEFFATGKFPWERVKARVLDQREP